MKSGFPRDQDPLPSPAGSRCPSSPSSLPPTAAAWQPTSRFLGLSWFLLLPASDWTPEFSFYGVGGSSFLILSFNIFLRLSVSPRWGLLFRGCVTVFANEGRKEGMTGSPSLPIHLSPPAPSQYHWVHLPAYVPGSPSAPFAPDPGHSPAPGPAPPGRQPSCPGAGLPNFLPYKVRQRQTPRNAAAHDARMLTVGPPATPRLPPGNREWAGAGHQGTDFRGRGRSDRWLGQDPQAFSSLSNRSCPEASVYVSGNPPEC